MATELVLSAIKIVLYKDSYGREIAPIVYGKRHCDCIYNAKQLGYKREDIVRAEQGFIDAQQRFYSREEARKIARENCWVSDDTRSKEILYSEDLWPVD
jgi:hypothetical protein